MPRQDIIDQANGLCVAAREQKATKLRAAVREQKASLAAGLRRPALANTTYTDSEPITSSERDNRESPACACGAPVYAGNECVRCHEEAFYSRHPGVDP